MLDVASRTRHAFFCEGPGGKWIHRGWVAETEYCQKLYKSMYDVYVRTEWEWKKCHPVDVPCVHMHPFMAKVLTDMELLADGEAWKSPLVFSKLGTGIWKKYMKANGVFRLKQIPTKTETQTVVMAFGSWQVVENPRRVPWQRAVALLDRALRCHSDTLLEIFWQQSSRLIKLHVYLCHNSCPFGEALNDGPICRLPGNIDSKNIQQVSSMIHLFIRSSIKNSAGKL